MNLAAGRSEATSREVFARADEAIARKPFAIGLTPIDSVDWIDVDDALPATLALKAQILAREREASFQALAGTEAIQAETRDLLAEHLMRRFPLLYRREGGSVRVIGADRLVALEGEPPLLAASRLVQEDLALLARDAAGWRLVAASLCFPSTWVLAEKIGRPLDEVHAPVPGFSGAMAARVARILDNLRPEAPLERFNVSIYGDAALRHAVARHDPATRFPEGVPILERAHLRIERQTLRRLPSSGAIVFTIRIHVDALAALARHARRAALAAALADNIAALSAEQLAYKGLGEARDRLLLALGEIGGEAQPSPTAMETP